MLIKIKVFLQDLFLIIFKKSKLKNYIIFESVPTYSDNTKYVFDEIIRRGLNEKYKCYWFIGNDEVGNNLHIKDIKNVYFIDAYHGNLVQNFIASIKKTRISCSAKVAIMCNKMLVRGDMNSKQFFVDLAHGEALKDCSKYYRLSDGINEVMCLSPFLAKYDAINFNCDEKLMNPLGYARNDALFGDKLDLSNIFTDSNFEKAVYWMPTYRQHFQSGMSVSSINMPIIYDEDIASKINECAKKNNILIVIKPHSVQDVSNLKLMNLSNLVIINDLFLKEHNIENYDLLRSVDALVTDYSSVYYDYLLCDKPIGLCFDDYKEYKDRIGFTVDPEFILAGGEKIYNVDDFCNFLLRLHNGEDILIEERTKIKNLCHLHQDGGSTKRIVDRIEEKLNKMI